MFESLFQAQPGIQSLIHFCSGPQRELEDLTHFLDTFLGGGGDGDVTTPNSGSTYEEDEAFM